GEPERQESRRVVAEHGGFLPDEGEGRAGCCYSRRLLLYAGGAVGHGGPPQPGHALSLARRAVYACDALVLVQVDGQNGLGGGGLGCRRLRASTVGAGELGCVATLKRALPTARMDSSRRAKSSSRPAGQTAVKHTRIFVTH